MLERVMGLSAHFAAWLGFALPARALHSLPGAGKGVTGAFSYPPFESPQFQFQQKYPPIREDIFVGAGNGTLRRHWGSAAASPGNSETIHCIVSAPRGDVPFESHFPIIISTKISPYSGGYFCWSG